MVSWNISLWRIWERSNQYKVMHQGPQPAPDLASLWPHLEDQKCLTNKPPMVSCSAWGNQCTTETEVQQTVSIFKSDHLNGLAHIWNCSCYCSIHMGETGDLHWILMFLALKPDLQNCPLGTNKVFSISPLIWSLTSPDEHYSTILAIDRGQDKKKRTI